MNKKMMRNLIIAAAALVVVVAAILVVVLVPFGGSGSTADEIDYGIDMSLHVNDDGLHTAKIHTNSKGEIENNSYGTLINYTPADIKKISMSTEEGNYTFLLNTPVNSDGTTEATVYTLEGFEDYDLADTNPSLLASSLAKIGFNKVADLEGKDAAQYGFDKVRAEAKVEFTDGTHSVVRLGDEAAGGKYCYIQFGDNDTVYVAAAEDMAPMLLKITELFSTIINADATDVADDSFDKIILGGAHLKEQVVIEANTEQSLSAYYMMVSHGNAPVSVLEGSNIVGSIRSLTAEEVVCVNPDQGQLKKYGLATPYATVSTNYSYTENKYDDQGNVLISADDSVLSVSLVASEEEDGYVYIMEKDGKLVYKIKSESVAWATTTMDKLKSEYVHSPAYSALESVVVKAQGKTYKFELSSKEVTETDEEGQEITTTKVTVKYGGEELDESIFYTFCQDLFLLEVAGEDDGSAAGDKLMTVTYNYNTGRAYDTVEFCKTNSQKVIPLLNGDAVGYVYKSTVEGIIKNIDHVINGEEITSALG